MRNDLLSTVAPAADADAAATPAAPKLPRAPRKPRSAKQPADAAVGATVPVLTTEPAPTPDATPADATPAPVAAEPAAEPAPRVLPIARTCATIARNATNFGGTLSDRDHAYITFYASLAALAADGIVTIRAIADSGRGPAYNGSAKPHDAGVVNRLRKAGLLTVEADGTSFAFTPNAHTLRSYVAGVGA